MGKVTIIIESSQMSSKSIRDAAQQILPTEEKFRAALLKLWGISPAEVDISFILDDEEIDNQ